MKQVFKSLKDKMDQAQQQAQQMQQQELQAQQEQFAAQMQEAQQQDEINKQFEAGQAELDRLNKKEIALIAAAAKERSGYAPEPNAGDENIVEAQKLAQQGMIKDREYQLKLSQIQQKAKESNDYVAMELKKVALDRERIEAQMKMKQMDIKAKKAQAKAKPKPKSK
jgi:hypothetical protein